jgi:L-fuculose-phosphate aldolase
MLNEKKMIFETFFLGKEKINNPLVKEMIDIGRILVDALSYPNILGNISTRYGKRVLITSCNERIGYLIENDFVEVADYDATRNLAFVIGKNEPSYEMPMHWLLYRREDINAIIHIHKVFNEFPTTELERLPGSLELVLEALKLLKNYNCINLKNHGCIAIGKNLRNAMEAILCV